MLNQHAALDSAFHALADPTRRSLLEALSRGPASVSELARPLPITLSAVMQHLDVLSAADLIASRKSGRVRLCSIRPEPLLGAQAWLADRQAEWDRRLDRLESFLRDTDPRQT